MLYKIFFVAVLINSLCYSQLGFQLGVKQNEITPSVYFGGDVTELYSFQWNLFNSGLVLKDPYNKNKFSGSIYSLYSTGAIVGIATIFGTGGEWFGLAGLLPDSSILKDISRVLGIGLIAPIALSNSQHFINIFGYDSASSSRVALSTFVGFQSDYFNSREISWFRFSPSIGVEVFYKLTNTYYKSGRFDGYGISIQFGITKNWDILKRKTEISTIGGFVNTKVHFPL